MRAENQNNNPQVDKFFETLSKNFIETINLANSNPEFYKKEFEISIENFKKIKSKGIENLLNILYLENEHIDDIETEEEQEEAKKLLLISKIFFQFSEKESYSFNLFFNQKEILEIEKSHTFFLYTIVSNTVLSKDEKILKKISSGRFSPINNLYNKEDIFKIKKFSSEFVITFFYNIFFNIFSKKENFINFIENIIKNSKNNELVKVLSYITGIDDLNLNKTETKNIIFIKRFIYACIYANEHKILKVYPSSIPFVDKDSFNESQKEILDFVEKNYKKKHEDLLLKWTEILLKSKNYDDFIKKINEEEPESKKKSKNESSEEGESSEEESIEEEEGSSKDSEEEGISEEEQSSEEEKNSKERNNEKEFKDPGPHKKE